MALHVLHGEFPAFFWGQAFKGVPEVYAAAGVFAVAGPSVLALKSVTLAFFAAYVALNFVLLDTIASRWVGVAASLLLILAPPALVFWSLDASAEYVLIMLLGTIFLLLSLRWQETRSPRVLAAIGLVTGAAFWVHQIFVFYLLPAAVVFLSGAGIWKKRRPGNAGVAAWTIGVIAMIYFALAAMAFLIGGFSIQIGSLDVSAQAPQKLLRIALGIGGIAGMLYLLRQSSRESIRRFMAGHWPFAAGFVIGYLPVLLYAALVSLPQSPMRNANLRQLARAAPDIFGNVIPIIAGFKIATTERLSLPAIAALPGVLALVAFLWSARRRLATDFFALFILFVPLLFLASGAYLDTQSYRYLIPLYAGLAVAWAGGSLWLARGNKVLAAVLVGTLLAVHAWQQVVWYRKLAPDTASTKMIDCLRREGIRGGFADYWTSYKLTFLSNEEIIIAPLNGIDRYPAYTAFVRSLPSAARMEDVTTACN